MRVRRLIALMMLFPALAYAQAGRELTDSVMKDRYQTSGSCPPAATFCDAANEVGREYVCTDAPNAGTVYYCTSVGAGGGAGTPGGGSGTPAFSAITSATNTAAAMVVGSGSSITFTGTGDIRAKTAQMLRSETATSGDTITLTSDGTDGTLSMSRTGSKLSFNDGAGSTIFQLLPSTGLPGGSDRGVWVNGHMALGRDLTGGPETVPMLKIRERFSNGGAQDGVWLEPIFDQDIEGNAIIAHTVLPTLGEAFDASAAGTLAGMWISFTGAPLNVMTGAPTNIRGIDINANITLPVGSPAWPEVTGINIRNFSIAGVTPANTYALRIQGGGGGTIAKAIEAAGTVSITSTNKLGLGRGAAIAPTNSIRSKTSTGSILTYELNSADEWELSTTAFYPFTNGANGIGQNANGLGDLWFKDTSAAFETRILSTSSTTFTADRTLTVDLKNADQTMAFASDIAALPGRSLTLTAGVLDSDAELYTQTKSFAFINPVTGDSGTAQMVFPTAVTITRVWCSTDTGTATIQFDERAEATPNTAGTDVMTSTLMCDATSEATTSFANASIAARVPMNLDIDAVASAPTKLRVHVEYTIDD